ncbi:hypothetical protein EJB05_32619 [Eragrostis curvula]|uniref:Uncharacterized protein n=1 Tax=Eragrostis curvula TaxID=38414 RepID=A0A5J9UI60_9POAL|nr:hypothetical protein EJB05_32619 [Eragrostis curvula]
MAETTAAARALEMGAPPLGRGPVMREVSTPPPSRAPAAPSRIQADLWILDRPQAENTATWSLPRLMIARGARHASPVSNTRPPHHRARPARSAPAVIAGFGDEGFKVHLYLGEFQKNQVICS